MAYLLLAFLKPFEGSKASLNFTYLGAMLLGLSIRKMEDKLLNIMVVLCF